MADTSYEILELRAVIKPDITELYICCGTTSDGGVLVGGWYKSTVGRTVPALEALREAIRTQAYLVSSEWSRGAPP